MAYTNISHKIKNLILTAQAYSLEVERAAHNGFVVGSSPTRPNQLKMDFTLKTYKYFRIKHYLKEINFFFFFQGASVDNESWIRIEQSFVSHELKYYRILNKVTINTLKNSVFKNVAVLIQGPIVLLNNNNNDTKLTFKELENINPLINLLGFRLNRMIYSKKQIKNLKKISYLENIYIFHKYIKTFTRLPYRKLKSKRTSRISK